MSAQKFLSLLLAIAMASSPLAWGAIDPAEINQEPEQRAGFQHQDVRDNAGNLQVGNNARIQAGNQVRQVLQGAPVAAGLRNDLQNAIQALPPGQQRQAAVRAAAVMNNPQAAAAINTLPPEQQAAAIMAVAAMPGTMNQKVAAAQMLAANPAILAQVAGAVGAPGQDKMTHQGQILSVLTSVPANQRLAVATALKTQPSAAATLARIPAGAGRATAMRIFANAVQNGTPPANLGLVATAVASPEARAILNNLTPAQQASFAPVMSNASLVRVLANVPAGANQAGRQTAILTLATAVAGVPGTAGPQRERNLNALASALSAPGGQAVLAVPEARGLLVAALANTPPAQQASVIAAGVRVLGNANMVDAVQNIPHAQLGAVLTALASVPEATRNQLAALPAQAATTILTAVAAAPANQRTSVLAAGVRAMGNAAVATAIQALPVGQQASAMLAVGNASAQTRGALANLPAADLNIVMAAAVAAPANQRTGVLTAGVRAMSDPGSAAVVRALPAAQQGAAIAVLGNTSGQTRTNFVNALNAAPQAIRGDMLQAVASARPASRAFVMGAVTRAAGNAGIAGAIAALPAGQRGAAMIALGGTNISPQARTALGNALAAAPDAAKTVMVNAVVSVGGGRNGPQRQALMVGLVTRSMGNAGVRDAIMAAPAGQRAGLMIALGGAGANANAMRTRFTQAINIPAVANLPAAQKTMAAAAIAAAPDGVRRFNTLQPAAQARIVDLAKAMASPNANVMSRAMNLMGNASFARALARLPAGNTQTRLLATAASGRAGNPVGALMQIANTRGGQMALANIWMRQNLPRDLLRS